MDIREISCILRTLKPFRCTQNLQYVSSQHARKAQTYGGYFKQLVVLLGLNVALCLLLRLRLQLLVRQGPIAGKSRYESKSKIPSKADHAILNF